MSWRDRMGSASFRGVPFHVDTAERGGGRRTVTHEFPLRDKPFVEDLGLAARSFQVDGYVVGEQYLEARDALIAALEEAGPGELLHPHYGTLRVICRDFRVRESTAEGGMARFSISFEETDSEPVFPVAAPDTGAQVEASAVAAREAVEAEFVEGYLPGVVYNAVADGLRKATRALNNGIVAASLPTQLLASLVRRLEGLTAAANTLLNKPANLAGELAYLIGSLPGAVALELYGADFGSRPPETTPARRREALNYDALRALVRRLAVVEAARRAPSVEHANHEAAVAAREEITDRIDEQLEAAGDEVYQALLHLRAALVAAVPGETSQLPRLLEYTPTYTAPSLVLAHRLYGDIAKEADLLTRNRIRHPGFVPGGRTLEVLTHG